MRKSSTQPPSFSRRLFLACGVASQASLFTACSGGGGGGSDPSTTPGTSTVDVPSSPSSPGPSGLAAAMAQALAGNSLTGTGGITTSATASRAAGTAPCLVFFDATATTNSLGINSFHDILYLWNFGDSEIAWTYGTGVGDNSKNRSRGAVAAHVYETAGTYTAKVTPITVSSSGTLSYGTTVSLTTVVAAANTTYAGTATICISTSGNFTGAPSGARTFTETTLAAAYAHLSADNQRILFCRGETWTANSNVTLSHKGVTQGAYGSGAVPEFQLPGMSGGLYAVQTTTTGSANYTVMDAYFNGVDHQNSSNGTNYGKRALQASSSSATIVDGNILMLRVETAEFSEGLAVDSLRYAAAVDCNFHDFSGGQGNVGIWMAEGEYGAVLGSRVADAFDIEHTTRFQGNTKILVQHSNLSQAGLRWNNGGLGGDKQIIALRGSSTSQIWTGRYVEHCIISDNIIDGGPHGSGLATQVAPQAAAFDERLRDVIIERNLYTGNISTCITSQAVRVTARNNLDHTTCVNFYECRQQGNINIPPPANDNHVYNNTTYSLSGKYFTHTLLWESESTISPTGLVVKNNLVYAPNATTNIFGNTAGPTVFYAFGADVTPGDYTVANNTSNAQLIGSVPGFTIPPTSTLMTWKPTSGYGIDAGVYVPVFDDFFGAARAPTFDLGAVNP